jgi:hypothetical protein
MGELLLREPPLLPTQAQVCSQDFSNAHPGDRTPAPLASPRSILYTPMAYMLRQHRAAPQIKCSERLPGNRQENGRQKQTAVADHAMDVGYAPCSHPLHRYFG